ncbi:class I SAM-dependent methyltransferase [Streptomyces sp. NPDC051940]|uniref:class I SAM-dependent methyltransferase n=1 Tax=Streptomyces sp. NPDC051940 TaxID=3155675 RepID=UPI003448C051
MIQSPFLAALRESYDTVADGYAATVPAPDALDPLSRAVLDAFAELVRDGGPVADVGCGPGKVTAYLAGMGVPVFGVDLSPRMVELARTTHPGLRFEVGSMTSLDVGDGALGGVLAFYSTHHIPPEELPGVLAEFHRTLAPGGRLLLVGRVGDAEHLHRTLSYGADSATFDSYRMPAERIAGLVERAGLVVTARLVQAYGEGTKSAVASLLAYKPGGS